MTYSLTVNNSRASIPNVMITNSGSQRFDLYAGPFTKNDQLTSSPFANAFVYIPDVPLAVARQVLPTLNQMSESRRRALVAERERERYALGDVDMRYFAWLEEMDRRSDGPERRAAQNATLGYVTHDVSSLPPPPSSRACSLTTIVTSRVLASVMTSHIRPW